MFRRFVSPPHYYYYQKCFSSSIVIINRIRTCSTTATFHNNHQRHTEIANQITQVESEISDSISQHHKNKREKKYYSKDQKYDSFPLTPVIQKWLDVVLFQDPDREILAANPELLCRWMIVSGELLIGEDNVDWACETLRSFANTQKLEDLFSPRLCLRTIKAFEHWLIKETPQCFGMIPLLKNIAANILMSSSSSSSVHERYHYMISAEDIAVMIGSIIKIFRKTSKGDRHTPVPDPVDAAVAEVIVALATRYLTSENVQQFEEWTSVVVRFFKVGIRRLPLTLSRMVESLFDPEQTIVNSSSSNNLQLRILKANYRGIVVNKLKQRNELTSASMSRQVMDALSVMQDVVLPVDSITNPTWDILFSSPMFSIVISQMSKWPLRDIGVVTALCLRYLSSTPSSNPTSELQKEGGNYQHQARTLLILSLRASYFGFYKIVRDSSLSTSSKSHHQNPTSSGNIMTVESALCANRFLDLVENSVPADVVIAASSGLPNVAAHHQNVDDDSSKKMMNAFGSIEEPARIISSRFPHLIKN